MVALTNTAEGGTDEADVTTGNSGGLSGNAWDSVTIGTNTTVKYDTAQAMRLVSIRIATGATSAQAFTTWSTSLGSISRCFGRVYIRASALATRSLIRIRGGGVQAARIGLASSGMVELRNGANTVVATTTNSISTGTWYRVEWDLTPGVATFGEVKFFTGDTGTPTEAISATSTYGATADEVNLGQVTNAANLADLWYDSATVNNVGYPGPEVVPCAPGSSCRR